MKHMLYLKEINVRYSYTLVGLDDNTDTSLLYLL